eukprot:3543720-Rhodomonas_salina.3
MVDSDFNKDGQIVSISQAKEGFGFMEEGGRGLHFVGCGDFHESCIGIWKIALVRMMDQGQPGAGIADVSTGNRIAVASTDLRYAFLMSVFSAFSGSSRIS